MTVWLYNMRAPSLSLSLSLPPLSPLPRTLTPFTVTQLSIGLDNRPDIDVDTIYVTTHTAGCTHVIVIYRVYICV